jgi:hypothetical protein
MEVPQANDRVKEAPANALRAMFAGIGRLLSVTDKIRNRPGSAGAPAGAETVAPKTVAPETVAPETAAPETVAAATAAPETAAPETAAPETATPEAQLDAPVSAGGHVKVLPAEPTSAAPAAPATSAEVAPAAAAAAAGELPLPNYDDLSIASLRARLRNLSAQQLRQLIEYEKGHADRADVITMFERRIAKLAEG